jgi:hypothetical protein
MKRHFVWLAPLLFAGCDLDITGLGSCDFDRDFSEVIGASGADVVRVLAEAGDLRVQGRAGATDVRVYGTACADNRRDLDDIEVVVQRVGGAIRVLTLVPAGAGIDAHADLVVEVPEWMLVDIDHQEGRIDVSNVAGVSIFDDSGDIFVSDVFGDVDINDDSGDIQLRNIDGDVWMLDDSGLIDVRGVGGEVAVEEDGSGDLFVRDVDFDVWIGEDGSGDIVVENVRGDLIVDLDSSGSIRYSNIGGLVFLPR